MDNHVSFENGRFVISPELRERLFMATAGMQINIDTALRELVQTFKTCNESMKILSSELRKFADTTYKAKPKPAKPYLRTRERWELWKK